MMYGIAVMMYCHGRTYFPESYMWVYVEQYWFKHNLLFQYYTFRQIFNTCWWFELSKHLNTESCLLSNDWGHFTFT